MLSLLRILLASVSYGVMGMQAESLTPVMVILSVLIRADLSLANYPTPSAPIPSSPLSRF